MLLTPPSLFARTFFISCTSATNSHLKCSMVLTPNWASFVVAAGPIPQQLLIDVTRRMCNAQFPSLLENDCMHLIPTSDTISFKASPQFPIHDKLNTQQRKNVHFSKGPVAPILFVVSLSLNSKKDWALSIETSFQSLNINFIGLQLCLHWPLFNVQGQTILGICPLLGGHPGHSKEQYVLSRKAPQ